MTEKTKSLEEVTLLKPHRHGGQPYKAGARIKVSVSEKAFLAKRGKIETTTAKAASKG